MTITVLDILGNEVTIPITEDVTKAVLQQARAAGLANKNWDINLAEGKHAEGEVLKLIKDSTVEVKNDFAVSKTGNLAIEHTCYGKPSGITATQAEWWALVADGKKYNKELIVLIKTDRLRKLVDGKNSVRGGDNYMAEMHLLPIVEIVRPL